ncbi:MAG: hypothetical protein AAF741_00075 [Bacteroidota bacterium]
MANGKLTRQLSAMDGRERERFRQFVNSPYFNQHEPTKKLLDNILESLPIGEQALSRERLHRKVFGRSVEYQEQRLADVMSSLMKLLSKFLAVEQLEEDSFLSEVLTMKRAEALGRYSLLKSRDKRLRRLIARSDHRDGNILQANFQRQVIYAYYRTTHENRADAQAMQQILDHLDSYYLAEKLRHACHCTANTLLFNTQFDFGILTEMLSVIESDHGRELFGQEPSIQCYYHILMSMRDGENPIHYKKLSYFLNQELDKFSKLEQQELYLFANNYCILRIRKGDPKFPREYFELVRRGIDTGLVYRKGQISEWNYKNFVTLGSKLGEYEWTEDFLESHYDRLPVDKRDNAYALNKAQYLYSRGRYDEAGDLLLKVTDNDVKYHLARVQLEVRIAYEQRETTYLLNQLETFRLYILRQKKISVNDKRSYTNYSRFAKQLASLKLQSEFFDKETLNRKLSGLHKKISDTNMLVDREWLLKESQPA